MAKKQFKAESKRLLELMINSIYTNKEIFLREIISNASDAEDKLCYRSLTDDKVGLSREDFFIQIEINKELRTISVTDNGIGMTKEDMESNLGTIARSGSFKFKNEMEAQENIDIIGQFGVGFYSAFMVADAVTVVSRAYGSDEAWCWQSSGADGYTMTECEQDTWGTTVVMHIKEDTEDEQYSDFLEEHEIMRLVRKYSDYIRYPIKLEMELTETFRDQDDTERTETTRENTTLNSMIPLWQKSKKDVTEDEYQSFYAEKFNAYDKPALTVPVNAEGLVSFKALLFVPGEIPFDFYSRDFAPGVQLYSSGVLIMDKCADLVPEHFRFIRGVVDTQDVSLNISREMLQHNRQLKIIAQNIDKKIRAELLKLQSDNREEYEKFFANFGMQLKYGTMNDYGRNKEVLKDLLIFYSSAEKKLVTFKEYCSRMPADQKYIFYAAGEDAARIDRMPQTEAYKAKGYEILYLTDSIDEMVVQMVGEYEGKKFRSVDDESALEADDKAGEDTSHNAAMEFVKATLGDKIEKARISKKLVSSPVCMVADGGLSFEMEKYFETLCKKTGEEVIRAKRVIEFNPDHKVLSTLEKAIEEDKEKAEKLVRVLYCQSMLIAELPLEDPKEYSDLVCDLLF